MADTSRFPQGVQIDVGDLTAARPVGTLVYDQSTGQIWRSLNAVTPSYASLTPSGPGTSVFLTNIAGAFTAANGAPTIILWDAPTSDPGSNYNVLTGEYTVPFTGIYQVNAFISWAADGTGVSRAFNLQLNTTSGVAVGSGNTVAYYNWFAAMPTPPAVPWNPFTWVGQCTAGRFLRTHVNQDSGGDLDIQSLTAGTLPFWSVQRVG